jgi:hypothetical protein
MSVAVVVFSLLHFAGTHRYPYDRVLGYFLIPALLGMAFLVDLVWRRIPSTRIRIATAIILPAVAAVAAPSILPPIGVTGLESFLTELKGQPASANQWTIPLLGSGVAVGVRWYVPSDWKSPSVLTSGHEAQVCMLLRGRRGISVTSGEKSLDWLPSTAAGESSTPFRLVRLVGQTKELTHHGATRALVFWYPDYLRLGLDAHGQLELAKASGLKFQRVTTRQRIKMDLFGRLFSLIFIADSEKEYETAVKTVEEGIARHGGSGVVFVY